MKTLPVAEVRSHFSSLLKEVASGKDIGISYGRKKETIAVIIALDEYNALKSRKLGTLQGKASIEFNGDWKISDKDLLKS